MKTAIYLFSGGAYYNPNTETYHPVSYGMCDHNNLPSDGISRCQATKSLDDKYGFDVIITSGMTLPVINQPENRYIPSYADIYTSELIRIGVKGGKIYLNNLPDDTATEIVTMLNFASNQKVDHMVGIVGKAQYERTKVLFEMLYEGRHNFVQNMHNYQVKKSKSLLSNSFSSNIEYLNERNFKFFLIPAEEIIGYAEYHQHDYSSRLRSEDQGIQMLKEGKYWT